MILAVFYLVRGLVEVGLLTHGNIQAGVQSVRRHLSVVPVENGEQAVLLVHVGPLHLRFASAGVHVVGAGGILSSAAQRLRNRTAEEPQKPLSRINLWGLSRSPTYTLNQP